MYQFQAQKWWKKKSFLTQNRFQVLACNSDLATGAERKYQEEENCTEKILLCADSHGKDLAWHLNKNIKSNKAYSFIHPGGTTRKILQKDNIHKEVRQKKDALIIWCGANDVARNEAQEAIENIRDTLEQVKDNKVYLVDIPHRFDLVEWSCVNKEIKKTNLALKRLCENYSNTVMIESSRAERHCFTKHGQHLNLRGKRWLAQEIYKVMQGDSEPTAGLQVTPTLELDDASPSRDSETTLSINDNLPDLTHPSTSSAELPSSPEVPVFSRSSAAIDQSEVLVSLSENQSVVNNSVSEASRSASQPISECNI